MHQFVVLHEFEVVLEWLAALGTAHNGVIGSLNPVSLAINSTGPEQYFVLRLLY